jgi:Mrp family chromosome partitioning ATPase
MKYQQDIFAAEAELAQHQAVIDMMSKQNQGPQASTNAVAQQSSSNTVAQQPFPNGPNMPSAADAVPAEKVAEYYHVHEMWETFRSKEKALLMTYLPENSLVKDTHQQIILLEKQKKQLEDENPGLTAPPAPATVGDAKTGNAAPVTQNDWMNETTHVVALQKKIEILTKQLEYIQSRITALDANADQITQLERTRKLEAQNYELYQTSLENTRIELAFGSGKASNIDIIQNPSAPAMNNSKMSKAMAGLAIVGVLIGLGLAFLIELYIDRSFKRPADIEARLGVPLFLSIPYRNGKSGMRLLKEPPKTMLALRSESTGRAFILNGGKTTIGRDPDSTVPLEDESISEHHCEIISRNGEVVVKDLGSAKGTFVDGERIVETTLKPDQRLRIGDVEFMVKNQESIKDLALPAKATSATPPWDPRHPLRPFYDTLRDRLITYFEVKNLTHNPKLVALTSCSDRAGVTSTAAGLAAALSETGEGNVLLVDMNVEQGAAHHFYKGHLSCGIDEAINKEKRQQARVQDHLYVVTESSSDEILPRVLPKRFNSLVSKLKASDFDYIIFDMPPMSQISITPRLAKFMDMVMVVVESEKTDRDVVQRAVSMLTETKANVSVVLNKRKNYVPRRLQQEL